MSVLRQRSHRPPGIAEKLLFRHVFEHADNLLLLLFFGNAIYSQILPRSIRHEFRVIVEEMRPRMREVGRVPNLVEVLQDDALVQQLTVQ